MANDPTRTLTFDKLEVGDNLKFNGQGFAARATVIGVYGDVITVVLQETAPPGESEVGELVWLIGSLVRPDDRFQLASPFLPGVLVAIDGGMVCFVRSSAAGKVEQRFTSGLELVRGTARYNFGYGQKGLTA